MDFYNSFGGTCMTKSVTVKDLKERLNLELICSETGLERPISTSDLSRPGLELTGFFLLSRRSCATFWHD